MGRKAIGQQYSTDDHILPSIHRWKVAFVTRFLPSCSSRSSPVSIGRVESSFSLSLSLSTLPPPPVALIRALVRPRWTHLLRSCRNQPLYPEPLAFVASRFKSARFSTRYFKSNSFSSFFFYFCRSWRFDRWRFFFFLENLTWSLILKFWRWDKRILGFFEKIEFEIY